jgi:hypothetical protein
MTTASIESPQGRRGTPLVIAGAGFAALAGAFAVGGEALGYAAIAFLVACLVALVESRRAIFTWETALGSLILVVWLIPIKKYRLPIELPFDLEVYRLLLLLIGFLWFGAILIGRARLDAGGQGKPAALLAVAATGALLANIPDIAAVGLETQAIKSLSFFLSFLLAFVLTCSLATNMRQVHAAVGALVFGATVVAAEAIYESRAGHNLFNDLQSVIPVLDFTGRTSENVRAGRLRVRASAQHPIALGAVLMMCAPLAIYLARAAATRARARLWTIAATILLVAAFATISRTVVFMLLTMLVCLYKLRRDVVIRLLPLLLVLPFLVKVAAPGSLRTLYAAFTPDEGLLAQQRVRAGEQGSGRIADLGPGLSLWADRPILGRALGTGATRVDRGRASGLAPDSPRLIFDNQYMHALVYLGALGFVAAIWFIWGTVRKLWRSAVQLTGPPSDLLTACAASCAAFGTSMFLFDAFAFVQVTLIFFVIAALGLRARALTHCDV